MRREPRYRSLTPLRAAELLEDTADSMDYVWRYARVRDALRDHVKAALVKAQKRKRRRA